MNFNFLQMDPAKGIEVLFHKITRRGKIVFLSAFITGLFAHLYQCTNKLFNYDELGATPDGNGAGLYLGRWGAGVYRQDY